MIIVLFIVLIGVAVAMALLAKNLSKNDQRVRSDYIINKFEPDNIAPSLGEMIDFHEKNGTVEYRI